MPMFLNLSEKVSVLLIRKSTITSQHCCELILGQASESKNLFRAHVV